MANIYEEHIRYFISKYKIANCEANIFGEILSWRIQKLTYFDYPVSGIYDVGFEVTVPVHVFDRLVYKAALEWPSADSWKNCFILYTNENIGPLPMIAAYNVALSLAQEKHDSTVAIGVYGQLANTEPAYVDIVTSFGYPMYVDNVFLNRIRNLED